MEVSGIANAGPEFTMPIIPRSRRRALQLACAALSAACISAAFPYRGAEAAGYPTQPVKIVVQSPIGNGPDITARYVAELLAKIWKQNVIVLNKPGGAGLIAAQEAARAQPDGLTLYLPNSSTFLVLPSLGEQMTVDVNRDFAPIGLVAEGPIALAVSPSLGVNSVAELIALAKECPGKIFHSALSIGTVPHLTSELLKKRAGIDMPYVAYLTTAKAVQDVANGGLSVVFDGRTSLASAVEAGHLKLLALTSATRLPQFPDVPVIAETLPGFEAMSWLPLLAPAGTPPEIIAKVSADLRTVLTNPLTIERFNALGSTVRPMTPAELAAFIKAEQVKWKPIVDEVDLKTR